VTEPELPTVVIVNYRTSAMTASLVSALLARYPGLPVVVVDNSALDSDWEELVDALPAQPRVTRSEANVGFGPAINAAVARIDTLRTLLLNPDLGSIPDIERLVQTANETGATIVGGLTTDDRGLSGSGGFGSPPSLRSFVRYALPLPAGPRSLMARVRDPSRPLHVGWVSGACLLVETNAVRSLGFDESLFLYAEDIDLCWRSLAAGGQVVLDPRVTIVHHAGTSSGGRPPLRWASNLALVMERQVRGARLLLALGLGWRGVAALVLGRHSHGRYLLASARSACRYRATPLRAPTV
jgi:N-acetylglucosaminyl-diphospho-decaprenol L-rhamnosyltransferase